MMYFSRSAPFVAAAASSVLAATFLQMDARAGEGDLRGADAIVHEASLLKSAFAPLKKQASSVRPDQDAKVEKLVEDMAGFALAKPLPPEEAARAWLDFLARWQTPSADPKAVPARKKLSFGILLRSLPQAEAWKFIAERLQSAQANPPTALQVLLQAFAADLRNDDAAFCTNLKTAEELFDVRSGAKHTFYNLKSQLLASTEDASVMADFFPTLARYKTDDFFPVPDLVSLLGEEKATALLQDALAQRITFDVSLAGERTATLARRLGEKMIDRMAVPQWRFAHHLEADALFKALGRRFGDTDDSINSLHRARGYYLLGLIARGKAAEAVTFVEQNGSVGSFPAEGVKTLRAADKSKEVGAFFDKLMLADSTLPDWKNYLQLAANVGNMAEGSKLIDKVKRNPAVPRSIRQAVEDFPWRLYVSMDQVDKGVRALRARIADEMPSEPLGLGDYVDLPDFFDHGLKLMNLGRVLHQESLVDEGLRAARFLFVSPPDQAKVEATIGPRSPDCGRKVAYLAERAGRPLEAEDILRTQFLVNRQREIEEMRTLESQPSEPRMSARGWLSQLYSPNVGNGGDDRNDLVALAGLYGRQHRPADVVALLDHAIGWHAQDLGEIVALTDWSKTPLGCTAARALSDLGRKEEAQRILGTLLETGSSYDPAYELFLELTPPENAIAVFERLLARDPFEQRSLIWKAEALKRKGDLDKAEAAARAAIEIDPSDGEQGCGLRMRAYTTLAEVLAAGKDPEPYRSAVRAIRLAEEADDLCEADLLTRAVPLYQKALGIFPDAYCIQSRLAMQLAALGKSAEAEKHYERAFELMPASFGRVGSFCSECKDVFTRPEAQKIAERVFARLAEQPSAKPQVFYLLSDLRQEEGRYPEALAAARRAVALDPDYLNAWKLIVDKLSSHLPIPRAEQDAALLNIVRLDPNRRHSSAKLEKIRDLAGLSKTVAEVQGRLFPSRPTCYPLAASAAFETNARSRILPPAATDGEKAADEFVYRDRKGPLNPVGPLPRAPEIIAQQESMHFLIELIDLAASPH